MKNETFCIDVTNMDFDSLNEMMGTIHSSYEIEIKKIATELEVSDSCAMDIFYLRGRSRWTQELEDELIELHKNGSPPNICEFGN